MAMRQGEIGGNHNRVASRDYYERPVMVRLDSIRALRAVLWWACGALWLGVIGLWVFGAMLARALGTF